MPLLKAWYKHSTPPAAIIWQVSCAQVCEALDCCHFFVQNKQGPEVHQEALVQHKIFSCKEGNLND